MASPEDSSAKNKKWATDEDWERHRPMIASLYETKTLSQLKDIMEKEYGFSATTKMYKTRFKRWGLWKYVRAGDAEVVQLLKVKDAEQKPTDIILNGRRTEFSRIERYLKRRVAIRRQLDTVPLQVKEVQPPPSSVMLVRTPSMYEPSSPSYGIPLPLEHQIAEDMFRAIRNYYSGSFQSHRWLFNSPADPQAFLSTPTGELIDGAKRTTEFHQRFKLAFRLLQEPDKTGPEGMKMTRICFAELPQILIGEDPTLVYRVLDIVWRLCQSNMRFLAVQLLQYLDGLSGNGTTGSRHATSQIWQQLLRGIGTLDSERIIRSAAVAADQFGAYLGETHQKTIEACTFQLLFRDATMDDKEAQLAEWNNKLDALDTFDYRHLTNNCNLANVLRKQDKLDASAEILERVLLNPTKNAVLRTRPEIAYNYVSVLGKVRAVQDRQEEAEVLYREGISIAKARREEMRSATGECDDTDLLDGLIYLEECLRAQERIVEADEVLEERKEVIRESLAKLGEQEDAV